MNQSNTLLTWLVGLLCLLATLPALAAETADARVVGIYVELAAGLYAERSGSKAEADLPLHAEVRVPGRNGAPARLLMVQMNGVDLGLGDLVEVNLGERGQTLIAGPRPTRAHVVRLQSRADAMLVNNTSLRIGELP